MAQDECNTSIHSDHIETWGTFQAYVRGNSAYPRHELRGQQQFRTRSSTGPGYLASSDTITEQLRSAPSDTTDAQLFCDEAFVPLVSRATTMFENAAGGHFQLVVQIMDAPIVDDVNDVKKDGIEDAINFATSSADVLKSSVHLAAFMLAVEEGVYTVSRTGVPASESTDTYEVTLARKEMEMNEQIDKWFSVAKSQPGCWNADPDESEIKSDFSELIDLIENDPKTDGTEPECKDFVEHHDIILGAVLKDYFGLKALDEDKDGTPDLHGATWKDYEASTKRYNRNQLGVEVILETTNVPTKMST